jgi:hypothetical protein
VALDQAGAGARRAFIDLHCHTRASFDSLANPDAVVRAAASRGLTHLAITDHDRIDAALEARDAAPDELFLIVGEAAAAPRSHRPSASPGLGSRLIRLRSPVWEPPTRSPRVGAWGMATL